MLEKRVWSCREVTALGCRRASWAFSSVYVKLHISTSVNKTGLAGSRRRHELGQDGSPPWNRLLSRPFAQLSGIELQANSNNWERHYRLNWSYDKIFLRNMSDSLTLMPTFSTRWSIPRPLSNKKKKEKISQWHHRRSRKRWADVLLPWTCPSVCLLRLSWRRQVVTHAEAVDTHDCRCCCPQIPVCCVHTGSSLRQWWRDSK